MLPQEHDACSPLITDIADEVRGKCKDQEDAKRLAPLMTKLTFSDKQLDELEKAIKDQANSTMWKNQQISCITTSNFYEVRTNIKSISSSKGLAKPQTTPLLVKLTQEQEIDQADAMYGGASAMKLKPAIHF